MSIKQRLALLLAIPLLGLVLMGALQLIEARWVGRQVDILADKQIESLAAVERIGRILGNRRVELRNCVVSQDPLDCARAREAMEAGGRGLEAMLRDYSDRLISNEDDLRVFNELKDVV